VGTRSLSSGARSRDPLALPTLQFFITGVTLPVDGGDKFAARQNLARYARHRTFTLNDQHASSHITGARGPRTRRRQIYLSLITFS